MIVASYWSTRKDDAIRIQAFAGANFTCEIHSGTPPTNIGDFNPAIYAGSLLASRDGEVSVFALVSSGSSIYTSSVPPAFNAVATGTASWVVFYNRIDPTIALVGECSLSGTTEDGLVHLSTLDLVAGQPISILDVRLQFNTD